MTIGNHLQAIALTLASAGAGAPTGTAHADEACAGIDTGLTDERAEEYADLIAGAISENLEPSERLKSSDVDIYDFLESGSWSAVYGAIPTADIAMFFFQEVDGEKQLQDVWGGWAEPSERPELIQWAENLGAPNSLATCFARYIVDDPATDQPFGFSLELELSDEARSGLGDRGEEIVVSASYYADPTPAGEEHADEIGQIDLGSEEMQVPAEPGVVQITGDDVDTGSLRWTEGEVMVNVNVYSARLSSDDNLISCDFIDGPLSAVRSAPVTLRCALITEDMETELKP